MSQECQAAPGPDISNEPAQPMHPGASGQDSRCTELLGGLFFQLVIRTDDDSQLPSDFSGRGGSNTCPTNTHTHVYIYIHIRCARVRTHNTRISAHGYCHNMSFDPIYHQRFRGPRVYSHPLRRNAWSGLRNHGPLPRRRGQVVNGWGIHPT